MADVYNDMVTGTKYKTPFAADVAIKMILEGKCGAFSPKIMDCLDSSLLMIVLYKVGDICVDMFL